MPFAGIRNADGSSAMSVHPWEGIGPWFSFDRVQWHRDQLGSLRGAGVDVILPVYAGAGEDRTAYAIRGLDALIQAMREMRADRTGGRERFPPRVGLYLETQALARQLGGPPDLKQEAVQRALYGVIREFFLHVPPEFRAILQRPSTPVAEGPDCALVTLGTASAFKDLDRTFADYCERRFRQEFGLGLIWLAAADFRAKAPGLDGYLPAGPGEPSPASPRSWIRTARLRPGYDNTGLVGATPQIVSRMNGRAYIEAWLEALRGSFDWVMLDGWNSYGDGAAIAPTLEYGLQYMDLTRAGVGQFKARGDYAGQIVSASVPRRIWPRAIYQVEVLAQNTGVRGWGIANRVGLSYRWYQGDRPVGDPAPLVLVGDVAPGEIRRLTIALAAPSSGGEPLPTGDYELRLDMQLPAAIAQPPAPTLPEPGGRRRSGAGAGASGGPPAAGASPRERGGVAPRPEGSDGAASQRERSEPGRWFSELGSMPYRAAVAVVGNRKAQNGGPANSPAGGDRLRPYWLGSTLPGMLQSGESYEVLVRVRNDGPAAWRREEGVAVGYRWRRVGVSARGAGEEADDAVVGDPLRVALPAEVPPGAAISVPVTVRVLGEGGRPLPVWDVGKEWVYQLEWDLFDGKAWASADRPAEATLSAARQTVQILEHDDAAEFLGSGLPAEMTAGASLTTKIGVRNNGPELWSPLRDRVVCRWYYPDGSPAGGTSDAARLPSEVRPGETAVVPEVTIRVPASPGPMFLVFDLKRGDRLVSAAANSRDTHLLVHPANVVASGSEAGAGTDRSARPVGPATDSFLAITLASWVNVDGISMDIHRADGNLDGDGRSFPGEPLPPYVWRPGLGSPALNVTLYPSGLWVRPLAEGDTPASPEAAPVPFRFPDKREGEKNAVACSGQRIPVPAGRRRAVHLMATATVPGAAGTLTLVFGDGTTAEKPIAVSEWTAGPQHGESIAFICRHRHRRDGDEPSVRAYLYHYRVDSDPNRPLAAVILPQNSGIKLFALTLEGG
jgi:hypothetical protein